MGAETFFTESIGKNAREAFNAAVDDALYWHGHGGYTGSIAEKTSLVEIKCPDNMEPEDYANHLIDKCDPRIDDKWGPAGYIKIGKTEDGKYKYLFFGWASS